MSNADSGPRREGRHFVVGLVADPGLPTNVVQALADGLPGQLAGRLGDDVTWRVSVSSEALPLDQEGQLQLRHGAQRRLPEWGWDVMICLTELPRWVDGRPLVFEVSTRDAVALVSVPALGWLRLRSHVREVIIHLVNQLAQYSQEQTALQFWTDRPRREAGLSKRLSPLREVSGRDEFDTRVVLIGVRARTRLLLGMVRHNQPWRMVPNLKTGFAAAAATAAFGVFYSSIWNMADAASLLRLALINVVAVAAMVGWLIVHNDLWERPVRRPGSARSVVYNASTVLTLALGVGCAYVLLFVATLIGALTVISSGYMSDVMGHDVDVFNYLRIAWLAASMGTVAGALGSGLESEAAIRQAAYSRREDERRQRQHEN